MFKCLILSVDICIELIGPLGSGFLFSVGSFDPDTSNYPPPSFRFKRIMSITNAVLWFTGNFNSKHIKLTAFLCQRLEVSCQPLCWAEEFFRSTTMANKRLRLIRQATRMLSAAYKPASQPNTHTNTLRRGTIWDESTRGPLWNKRPQSCWLQSVHSVLFIQLEALCDGKLK